MILLLRYVSLLTCILPILSLSITVPTQPPPLVNASTSVLLTWSSDDPSHFLIAVQKIFSPDSTVTSSIQKVENVTATCNVSVVFESAGKYFIRATKTSPTQANANVTIFQSEPFHVDEGPATGVSASSLPISSEFASATSSTVSSTANASATPGSSKGPKAAIIAGVVCGTFLLALITTILLIWRYRKRRSRAPSRAFLNDLDDKRQPRASRNDQPPNDPPPAYSPRISRAASKLFRWARGDDDSAALKDPLKV